MARVVSIGHVSLTVFICHFVFLETSTIVRRFSHEEAQTAQSHTRGTGLMGTGKSDCYLLPPRPASHPANAPTPSPTAKVIATERRGSRFMRYVVSSTMSSAA